jgi:isopentenyl phosphate kinase
VLGHGSGSFGHGPARRWGTRAGVRSPEEWLGFAEVWRAAQALNRLVLDALSAAGLPAIAFPPSAAVTARDGQVAAWDLDPIRRAMQAGLLPVIYGDVVFDTERGGTILSTEDLFAHLARQLRPGRLLLAGLEPGVWADFPACTRLIAEITPQDLPALEGALGGSAAPDVTGGMASKVKSVMALAQEIPGLEALVFSGETPGSLRRALLGERVGTILTASRQAMDADLHSATGYYNQGLLLAQDTARAGEAETAYRKAIELEPDNARFVYRLGLLLHENLHRFAEAEIAYRRAIELAPEDAYPYGGLISLLVQQSRRSEALALSLKMRAALSASENWYGLAALEAVLGNVEAAIENLRQAASQANFDRQWAKSDPDLASIRDDPRFAEITGSP